MPRINFSFSGWVNGANIEKVTVVETFTELDVSDRTAEEIIEKLNDGTWAISLEDHLYTGQDSEVELMDYEENEFLTDNDNRKKQLTNQETKP